MRRSTIVLQWALVAAVLTLWIANGRSATSIGLAASRDIPLVVSLAGSVMLALLLLRQVRAVRSMAGDAAETLRRRMAAVETLMPHTAGERSVFVGLSVTAGFCEELLYRGFAMAYLAPWLGWWGAGIGSAILFGIGHAVSWLCPVV